MTEQLSLFSSDATRPTPQKGKEAAAPEVVAAAGVAALEATARALPPTIFLGTSSWSFPTWEGLVYGGSYDQSTLAHGGLAAYCQHPLFRCVGIDRTFYAPIEAEDYARYAAQVPEGFRFLVKAPLSCVSPHLSPEAGGAPVDNRHFLDPEWTKTHFIQPALEGLGERAGPLVFQFPPLPRPMARAAVSFAQGLEDFFRELPKGPLYAVELRDEALLTEEYLRALSEVGVRHCLGLHPRQPAASEQARMLRQLPPGPLVVRWNLHPDFGYEQARARYFPFCRLIDEDLPARVAIARLCVEAAGAGATAFIVANNKAEGSAPLTIVKLAELIAAEWGTGRAL
jgi:uncharacterized protein YecE (DUF72 family)